MGPSPEFHHGERVHDCDRPEAELLVKRARPRRITAVKYDVTDPDGWALIGWVLHLPTSKCAGEKF
jgi:hypothetical protein